MRFGISSIIPIIFICLNFQLSYSQDTTDIDFDLDIDAMFEQAVWEEIQEVTTVYYETEKITATAGVRGAEAEDEALALLYYRKSMRGLSKLDIQKALGKLIIRREQMSNDNSDVQKIDSYIVHLKNRLKST
jgi:hypothetical protein